ncbi:MAG: UDP-N-acetylmuramate-L-alanine ligase [Parcubacteria group bacterium GW2011_GWC1_38_6]|nr:MAG: UDP-N-acetylmuramate-L-alanine ligase [Parcubacteria group bacterium GW2011_GWC1_38_6]
MKNITQNKVHFIGIGGIGTSALASYFLHKGHKISGSDLVASETTDDLKRKGVRIAISKKSKKLPKNLDLVIFSPAIPRNNLELKEAFRLQASGSRLRVLSYPEALGELTRQYFTIAVSGTHGKSTTTAMLALVLVKAGLDPTVIVGTKVKEFGGSNCRIAAKGEPRQGQGKSKYLVIEADEHMASFLNYRPQIIVLTNIEEDHLDFYKNLGNILKAFKKYISFLPSDGVLVANKDDKNIRNINSKFKNQKSKSQFKIQNYSLSQSEAKKLRSILKIPGEHNVTNALAVFKVAKLLKIPEKKIIEALSEYRGVWRRFEVSRRRIGGKNVIFVSDYAHHPTEVEATFKALQQKFKNKKIICIFQPHQQQRTFYLFKDFVRVLKSFPGYRLIITDVFDVVGREKKGIAKKVNAKMLVSSIDEPKVIYMEKKNILNYLKRNLSGGEVVAVLGAGDIYKLII